jgi:hypothetical protein
MCSSRAGAGRFSRPRISCMFMHVFLWRWCGQMLAPLHSLQSLLRCLCGQKIGLPHSLLVLLWRLCGAPLALVRADAPPHLSSASKPEQFNPKPLPTPSTTWRKISSPRRVRCSPTSTLLVLQSYPQRRALGEGEGDRESVPVQAREGGDKVHAESTIARLRLEAIFGIGFRAGLPRQSRAVELRHRRAQALARGEEEEEPLLA